jgi:hypothetical protein
LVSDDVDAESGFFALATSMAIDGHQVWMAGSDSLRPGHTLFIRRNVVTASGLAVWSEHVVLGAENCLFA